MIIKCLKIKLNIFIMMNHEYCGGGDGEDNDENHDKDLNVD